MATTRCPPPEGGKESETKMEAKHFQASALFSFFLWDFKADGCWWAGMKTRGGEHVCMHAYVLLLDDLLCSTVAICH